MSKKDKTIKVVLTFTENDLNTILRAANLNEEGAMTVDDVIEHGMWKRLEDEMNIPRQFVSEIVDGSYEACANDWLSEFSFSRLD